MGEAEDVERQVGQCADTRSRGVRILVQLRGDQRKPFAQFAHQIPQDGLLIGFCDGALLATAVKPDGRGEMDAAAWLCGARLPADARWEPVP